MTFTSDTRRQINLSKEERMRKFVDLKCVHLRRGCALSPRRRAPEAAAARGSSPAARVTSGAAAHLAPNAVRSRSRCAALGDEKLKGRESSLRRRAKGAWGRWWAGGERRRTKGWGRLTLPWGADTAFTPTLTASMVPAAASSRTGRWSGRRGRRGGARGVTTTTKTARRTRRRGGAGRSASAAGCCASARCARRSGTRRCAGPPGRPASSARKTSTSGTARTTSRDVNSRSAT